MKTKFTQGEWTIAEALSGKTFVTIDSGKVGMARHQICEIMPDIKEGDPQANAKLIAAAPDLLEALKEAEYDVKDWAEYNEMQAESFEENEKQMQLDIATDIKKRLAEMQSAIRKATE